MYNTTSAFSDLIYFSSSKWNSTFQGPQHLLSRFARHRRVFYIEEPVFNNGLDNTNIKKCNKNLWIITPQLHRLGIQEQIVERHKNLLSNFFEFAAIKNYVFLYHTPTAIEISNHLYPQLTICDCANEYSTFKPTFTNLTKQEQEVINLADIILTEESNFHEAKKVSQKKIHLFPNTKDDEFPEIYWDKIWKYMVSLIENELYLKNIQSKNNIILDVNVHKKTETYF